MCRDVGGGEELTVERGLSLQVCIFGTSVGPLPLDLFDHFGHPTQVLLEVGLDLFLLSSADDLFD